MIGTSMITQYRTKVSIIEAVCITKDMFHGSYSSLPFLIRDGINQGRLRFSGMDNVFCVTPDLVTNSECEMRVKTGDYIAVDIRGKVYGCPKEVFEEMYEPVPPQEKEFLSEAFSADLDEENLLHVSMSDKDIITLAKIGIIFSLEKAVDEFEKEQQLLEDQQELRDEDKRII